LAIFHLAAKMGIAASLVQSWERNELTPTEADWRALATVLSLETGLLKPSSPTVHCCVGI